MSAKPSPIPLSVPLIEGNAWRYVKECLDTQWVSSVGAYVGRFEQAVAAYVGARYAVAASSGTAALHTALLAADIGPGDGVLVPALTFIATANAVAYCGAACVFVDCEPARFNLDLDALEAFLNGCRRRKDGLYTRGGVRLKAVLPTHVLGYPVDMPRLLRLARGRGLVVVEDAAESIGSTLGGRHTGTFGAAGCLSFNGNKVITCGGGGMVVTDDRALARRAKHLTQQARSHPSEYRHDTIGYNYRMTNIAAALGLSQLELLPAHLRRRERAAEWYRRRLKGVRIEPVPAGIRWNHWLMSVQATSPVEKRRLLLRLRRAGCEARALWLPVPLQKPYRAGRPTPAPVAQRAYATVVNIPSSSSLTEAQVERVASVLSDSPLARALI